MIDKKILAFMVLFTFVFNFPAFAAPPLPNPAPDGKPFGLPTIGTIYTSLREKDFFAATFAETLFGRLELSYAFNNLQLGAFRRDVKRATGLDTDCNHVQLHHFNLRANLIPENAFGQKWLPAVTAGAHYKYNSRVDSINHRLGGVLKDIGVEDNDGMDFADSRGALEQGVSPRSLGVF